MICAEAVKIEVERFLLTRADSQQADWLLADYDKFIAVAQPERIAYPSESEVIAARKLIRHAADVPVLVSAMQAKPDWLLTNNREHFTSAVADRTGLHIADPPEFIRVTQS